MDIVRLKLKVEELERSNEEKFRQIKNLNEELNNIKIAEYNNLYLNEEMQNKTKLLGTYDNYLKDLRKENEQLRNKKLQLEKKIITT